MNFEFSRRKFLIGAGLTVAAGIIGASPPEQADVAQGSEKKDSFFTPEQIEKNKMFLNTLSAFMDIPQSENLDDPFNKIYATGGYVAIEDNVIPTLSLLKKNEGLNEGSESFVEFGKIEAIDFEEIRAIFISMMSDDRILRVPIMIVDEKGESVFDHSMKIIDSINEASLFHKDFDPERSVIVGFTNGNHLYADDSNVMTLEEIVNSMNPPREESRS